MNLKQLQYFCALAEKHSYSAAARELEISQPTLTQSVQKLENTLGTSLFDRSLPGLPLTPAGEVFLKNCLKINSLYQHALDEITELNDGIAGTIRLGTAPFRAQYMMPRWLVPFRRMYPDVLVQVEELLTADLFRALENGQIDIAVTATDKKIEGDLSAVPVAEEEVLVAVHRGVAAKNGLPVREGGEILSVDFSAFRDVNFILLGEDQLLNRQFHVLARESETAYRSLISCRSVETSLSLADAGLGAAFVLSTGLPYYRKRFPNLCYYSIPSRSAGRRVYAVTRKDQYLSRAAEYLLSQMKGEK